MSRFTTIMTIVFLLLPAMLFSTERLPRPEKITLDNGLVIYYLENPELPLVSFRLLIKGAGSAFEPEQRYEAPDGSPLTLDTDMCGQKHVPSPLPGPFAAPISELHF